MAITEKDVQRISAIILVALLAVLAFIVVRPVLISIVGGLILAYIFFPVFKWTKRLVKYKSLSAAIVSVIALAIIVVPLWFLIPVLSEQVFEFFKVLQQLDINNVVRTIFPSASEQFIAQVTNTFNSASINITSSILDSLTALLGKFTTIALHLVLVAFVFFFALRDGPQLKDFVSELSPLNKVQEKVLVNQFKDMTDSIVYGQVIIGVIQGILAGIGFFIFRVEHSLLLTGLAIILGIIPVIGVAILYIPLGVYMLVDGHPVAALIFLAYNLLIVSTIDNVLRPHLVSRKTKISQVIILIGMIGGFFIFGILGLILGPLILAYFLTFLRAYKDKNLSSLFNNSPA